MGKPELERAVRGFTLVELLTVIAIIGILAAILLAAAGHAREQAKGIQCASQMRSLGTAFHLFANDNNGAIPPSWHSAGSRREQNWAWQIKDYVHQSPVTNQEAWRDVFERYYHCPTQPLDRDRDLYSYGLNVYFELTPENDSYEGNPETWHRIEDLVSPSRTVLLGEASPTEFGDHFMAHEWVGEAAAHNAIDHDRHQGKANYLFADGNVRRLAVDETFDPANKTNLWHPAR